MLRSREEELWAELATAAPTVTAELRDIQELIRVRELSTDGDFSAIRSPKQAIILCLREANRFMSKQEIVDEIIARGFVIEMPRGKWQFNDTINYLLRKGELITVGEKQKWEMLIGLPNWEGRSGPIDQ